MDTKQQFSLWYFVAALVAVLLIQSTLFAKHSETLQYSEFKTLLKQGKVDNVSIAEQTITGTFNNDGLEGMLPAAKLEELKPFGKGKHPFATVRVADTGLTADLEAAKVPFGAQIDNKWLSTLIAWVAPAVIFVLIWSFAMKRMGGAPGMMAIGKSKAKVYMEKQKLMQQQVRRRKSRMPSRLRIPIFDFA